MTIKAQTTGNALLDAIGEVIERGLIVSPSSPEIVAFYDEIKKLDQADHVHAVEMQALLMHLTGDINGAIAALAQCQQCDPTAALVLLSNYSRCVQAQPIYAAHCRPETGLFTRSTHIGRTVGAFRLMASFARQAQRMSLSNLENIDLEEIFMVDRIFEEFGISDDVTGDLMQTAGSVLTDHGMMFLGESPEIDVFDIPGELRTVHVTYHIPTSAAIASDMYLDFIGRLFATERTIPRGFHISFEGVAHAG